MGTSKAVNQAGNGHVVSESLNSTGRQVDSQAQTFAGGGGVPYVPNSHQKLIVACKFAAVPQPVSLNIISH